MCSGGSVRMISEGVSTRMCASASRRPPGVTVTLGARTGGGLAGAGGAAGAGGGAAGAGGAHASSAPGPVAGVCTAAPTYPQRYHTVSDIRREPGTFFMLCYGFLSRFFGDTCDCRQSCESLLSYIVLDRESKKKETMTQHE